jgi:hypothetical protein
VKQFVAARDSERRSILRHLTDEQYDDIMRVCESFPHIEMRIKSGVFDDENENTVTVGAIVTLTVTLVRHSLRILFDKEAFEEKLLVDEQQQISADAETTGQPHVKPFKGPETKLCYTQKSPEAAEVRHSSSLKTICPTLTIVLFDRGTQAAKTTETHQISSGAKTMSTSRTVWLVTGPWLSVSLLNLLLKPIRKLTRNNRNPKRSTRPSQLKNFCRNSNSSRKRDKMWSRKSATATESSALISQT